MIETTLKHIEEQTGLKLQLCDYFTGIREFSGDKYFNIVLNEKISESKDFDVLKRFADKYRTIIIEPNGVSRVAIFVIAELSH